MDIFCEHMVKQKKTAKNLLLISLWIIAAAVLSVLFFYITIMFASAIAFSIFVVADAAVWYACYVLVTRHNVEYEMTLTNGDLDVDAIFSKKRRVHILSVRVRDFEICAPVFGENINEKFKNIKDIKKIYNIQSNTSKKGVYFADFYYKAQKVRLIFEPSDSMIKKMKIYNEKNIFIGDDNI